MTKTQLTAMELFHLDLERLAEMETELAPYLQARDELKASLKKLVIENGMNGNHAGVTYSYVKPGESEKIDKKRLKRLAEEYPELLEGVIWYDYRPETARFVVKKGE